MLANGIKEITTTMGTGSLTLKQVIGFTRFADGFTIGSLTSYAIKDNNNWEWGIGTVGAGNTLTRTTITATLVNGVYTTISASAITIASGVAEVVCADHTGTIRENIDLSQAIRPSYVSAHPGTLTRGMPVCLINGQLRKATSQAPFNIVIGLVLEDALLQGETGRIQTDLNFTTTSLMWDGATGMIGGLVEGKTYFLTASGAITPFPPTNTSDYISQVGVAISQTIMRLTFPPSILL